MGATGVACFILVFWGHYIVDLAGWLDLILVLVGLTLIGLEIFVVPGFGLTGIVGFCAVVVGLYFMVVPFVYFSVHLWGGLHPKNVLRKESLHPEIDLDVRFDWLAD